MVNKKKNLSDSNEKKAASTRMQNGAIISDILLTIMIPGILCGPVASKMGVGSHREFPSKRSFRKFCQKYPEQVKHAHQDRNYGLCKRFLRLEAKQIAAMIATVPPKVKDHSWKNRSNHEKVTHYLNLIAEGNPYTWEIVS